MDEVIFNILWFGRRRSASAAEGQDFENVENNLNHDVNEADVKASLY